MTIPPHDNPFSDLDKPLPSMTLQGVIVESVEGESAILRTMDSTYDIGRKYVGLLGHRVRVTGRVRPDIMTMTQQGEVFTVESLEDLGLAD